MLSITTLIIAAVFFIILLLVSIFVPNPITWLMTLALGGIGREGANGADEGRILQGQDRAVRHDAAEEMLLLIADADLQRGLDLLAVLEVGVDGAGAGLFQGFLFLAELARVKEADRMPPAALLRHQATDDVGAVLRPPPALLHPKSKNQNDSRIGFL